MILKIFIVKNLKCEIYFLIYIIYSWDIYVYIYMSFEYKIPVKKIALEPEAMVLSLFNSVILGNLFLRTYTLSLFILSIPSHPLTLFSLNYLSCGATGIFPGITDSNNFCSKLSPILPFSVFIKSINLSYYHHENLPMSR